VYATQLRGEDKKAVDACVRLLKQQLNGGVFAVTGTVLAPAFPKVAQWITEKMNLPESDSRMAIAAPLIVAGFGAYQYIRASRQLAQAFRKAVFKIQTSNDPRLSELAAKSKYLTITPTGLILGTSWKPWFLAGKTRKLE